MGNKCLTDEPLASYTAYGVGGKADELWLIEDIHAFAPLWQETLAQNIPHLILGQGSNLLPSDKGFRGRVFVMRAKKITWDEPHIVTAEAGCPWQVFIENTAQSGYGDLCLLSGIPGNVGGFVRGNAGAFGLETSDKIHEVTVLNPQGELQTFSKEACEFVYRGSFFKEHPDHCVISATFTLSCEGEPNDFLAQMHELARERWSKYPKGRSCGSFFKNPPSDHAGRLLDAVGAKGQRCGGAEISEQHANFFINVKHATQADLLTLARTWRDVVQKQHGIMLSPEVHIIDEQGHTKPL